MKKVKLMLLSLCVFAAVGGALAFNAKTGLRFCTATPNTSGSNRCDKACPNAINLTTQGADVFLCTTPVNEIGTECQDAGSDKQCGATSVQYHID